MLLSLRDDELRLPGILAEDEAGEPGIWAGFKTDSMASVIPICMVEVVSDCGTEM